MLKELRGTEKQIKWAKEIRAEKMKNFYEWKEKWEGKWTEQGNQEELEEIKKYTEIFENIEEASKWISIERNHGLYITDLLSPKKRGESERFFKSYEIF